MPDAMTSSCFHPQPIVSVCMITYNHERFVAQAIESVLQQRTSCGFELVIGDDQSTDNTRSICESYARSNPNVIRLLPAMPNMGMHHNALRTMKACRGRYLAWLEGDDCWTDPDKLQRQSNALDSDPTASIVFSNACVVYDDSNRPGHDFNSPTPSPGTVSALMPPFRSFASDLALGNYICHATSMKRNVSRGVFPDWIIQCPAMDWGMHLLSALQGGILFENCNTAIYRIHRHGVWNSRNACENAFDVWSQYGVLLACAELEPIRGSLAKGQDLARISALRSIQGRISERMVALETTYRGELEPILRNLPRKLRFSKTELLCLRRQTLEQVFYRFYWNKNISAALLAALRMLPCCPSWFFQRASLGVLARLFLYAISLLLRLKSSKAQS